MDPRSRNMTSGGQRQDLYDHSTPYGRFNSWLNRLPWNWILITLAVGFLLFIFYISIEPSMTIQNEASINFPLDTQDWANASLQGNGMDYVFEGDGIHPIKFPGFDPSLNTSSVEAIHLKNVHVDLPDFFNQISENGLQHLESIYFENVSISGTLSNQLVPKVKLSFLQ